MEILRFGLVARKTKTSREREVIEMMDYIPETVRPNNGEVNERNQPLVDIVKANSDLIIECCGYARKIRGFISANVDENAKPNCEPNCLVDEVVNQQTNLRVLQTLLAQITSELGA